MSKRTRTLLLSVIALVALLGVMFGVILLLPSSSDGDSTQTTTETEATTIAFKPTLTANSTKPTGTTAGNTTVYSVNVTTPKETFTIETNDQGNLRVKGFDDLEDFANTVYYTNLIEELEEITALRMANSAPSNPEDFGFDTEKGCSTAKLDVLYTDGSTISFEIGDESPKGDGYYFRESNSAAIYVVDTDFVDTVSQPSTGYLSMLPISAPTASQSDSDDTTVVRDATLSGTVRPEPIRFQISGDPILSSESSQILTGYYLTKPFKRNLKNGTDMLTVSTFSGFYGSDVAMLRPTEADFAKYGLDNPYSACTVNLSIRKSTTTTDDDGNETTTYSFYNTFEYTIKLGNVVEEDESLRYAVVYHGDELVPIVYEVVTSSLKWAEVQYDDLADELLFFSYITDVKTFTVTLDGVTTSFELTHYTDTDDSEENLKVVSDGTRYDTQSFRDVYQALIGILRAESTAASPSGEPMLTVNIQTNADNSNSSWVKIYTYSAGKYMAVHDTGETYLVYAKDVESALSTLRNFLK